jgi:uncharacterized protein YyaL (SSP411 family)
MQPSNKHKVLGKLRGLTNRWGVYQHGYYKRVNKKFGYALDDQARALIVAKAFGDKKLERIYEGFLKNSFEGGEGMYQFYYDRGEEIRPDKKVETSEDALGMTAWAIMETGKEEELKEILEYIKKRAWNWDHLRSKAYLLLGLSREKKESVLEREARQNILDKYQPKGEWRWFEDKLTYANGLLPWALWREGRIRGDKECLKVAEESTNFLVEIGRVKGVPAPVGCKAWYRGEGRRSIYDQQPVDVAYMMGCLEEAFWATGEERYRQEADEWWNWFWGNNTRRGILIDENWGCFDGLTNKPEKVNLNQGAESNISFLMAYLVAKRLGLKFPKIQ